MATIVYLDADDEITSAASRIRAATDDRVGLVLPFGSRVATSRINLRLLAREAQASGRRLDIVAPDASARALAVSAGIAVFASVGEYEAALDADEADGPGSGAGAAGAVALGAAAALGAATPGGPGDGRPIDPSRDTVPTQRIRAPITEPASADYGAPGVGERAVGPEPRVDDRAVRRDRGGGRLRGVLLLVGALVLLGAGAAYAAVAVLPTAEITLTPRYESLGPISFDVTADPAATAVDTAAGVIPATTVEIPVSATGEFKATGRKVVREKARGGVRFSNCDPSARYTIPSGTVVSTRGGTGFALDEAVFLPVATISGTPPDLRVQCTTSEVSVTATEAGEDGNVDAGAIRVVPARYNRNLIRVTNPAATSGGSREEFPRVKQSDVDAAIAQLRLDTQAQLEAELDNADAVPEGTTVFPETAAIGGLATDVDPATLVDQEVETFTLTMSGTGTVQAVDESPIQAIATERLQAAIGEGYELVEGSIGVDVGEGSAADGVISFPVAARALQLRVLDPEALVASVLGRSAAEAEALLAPFGDAVVVLWPDFVTSIPSDASRVTITVAEPAAPLEDGGSPTPAPEPLPSADPPESEGPLASPDDGGEASPSPALFPLEERPSDGVPTEPVPSG